VTASTITAPAVSVSETRFLGLGALVRKDILEWRRSRRAWVVAIVTTILMTLTALANWINTTLRAAFPPAPGEQVDLSPVPMDPLTNLVGAVTSQFFILAAIFAVASLLIRERESGTLAWVSSKPVTRSSIWLAKWLTASVMLTLSAVLVPYLATVAVVIPTYGMPDLLATVALAGGMIAVVVFFAAASLMFSTMLPSQVAVAAAGLGLFALPVFVGLVPLPLTQFLPHSMLTWPLGLVMGAPVGFITPVAYVVVTAAVVLYGMRRLERLEL
jgi:ABC-2 type transport system permease protein